jgi:O-antigen ligase
MIPGMWSNRPRLELSPARFLVLSLLPILALLPPETRGESMAGCAALIAVLALVGWRRSGASLSGQPTLLVITAVALPLTWVALAPAAAVEPLALALLAGAAGLGVAGAELEDRHRRRVATVLAVVAAWVALHALYQWAWGLDRLADVVRNDAVFPDREAILVRLDRGRPFASFATPAVLGGFLTLALPVTVALAWAARGAARVAWVAAAACQVGALLAAASATATAALAGSVLLALWAWARARRTLAVVGLASVLLLGTVVLLRGDRLTDLSDPEGPWRLRAGNFRAAWSMVTDRPWTGVGPGGFSEAYPSYRRPGDNETRHAHNLPLELAAESGWPLGTALALLFFWLFLRPLWRERDGPPWRRGLALGLAAFALQNLADFSAFMPSLLWTAALLRGTLTRSDTGDRGVAAGSRVLAASSLTLVLLAASVAGLSGLSSNAFVAARSAAFAEEPARALELASRAAGLTPWDADASLLLARITVDLAGERAVADAHELALERADRAVALSPVRPSARELRSRIRMSTGDPLGAYADLCEAARLYPLHEGYAAARDRLRESLEAASAGRVR